MMFIHPERDVYPKACYELRAIVDLLVLCQVCLSIKFLRYGVRGHPSRKIEIRTLQFERTFDTNSCKEPQSALIKIY